MGRALLSYVQLTPVKPRASMSEVQYSVCGVGQKIHLRLKLDINKMADTRYKKTADTRYKQDG